MERLSGIQNPFPFFLILSSHPFFHLHATQIFSPPMPITTMVKDKPANLERPKKASKAKKGSG